MHRHVHRKTTDQDRRNLRGLKITSAAKTVADCFKFRSRVGLDVALEALRDYLGRRGRSIDELLAAADACRVRRVMMPYVESLA